MPDTSPTQTHQQYKHHKSRSPEKIVSGIITARWAHAAAPVIIAVGGPGGTGKTTFCARLSQLLPQSVVVRLDDYKTSRSTRQDKNVFGAHPCANKITLIKKHIGLLKRGQSISKPVYNAVSGEADATEAVQPGRFVILDGEISTYKEFRAGVDISIFIDSDWKTQLSTRINRDIDLRGYSREKAIATFLQSNLREFARFGAESKAWADIHLYCHDDYRLEVEALATEYYSLEQQLVSGIERIDLSGLVVPLATPFAYNNRVDTRSLVRHIEFLARHGVKRLLVNGTTGEFFSLTLQERRDTFLLARRFFPGMILFHPGCDSLAQALAEAAWAEYHGADAIVMLPPWYIPRLPHDGIVAYFNRISEALSLPLILYNSPLQTQNGLTKSMLKRIRHHGLKDNAKDLAIIKATPRYFIGGDRMIVNAYEKGACGFVSAKSNMHPAPYVALEKYLAAGDCDSAQAQQQKIHRLCDVLSGNREIPKIKYALAHRIDGYRSGVRLPLQDISDAERKDVDALVLECR
ncbi:MAG: hypothetical protein GF398_05070 [Chitinivibrionales bacterium]|nr:hypothetical protein [Chitinivibrionales bacterium]